MFSGAVFSGTVFSGAVFSSAVFSVQLCSVALCPRMSNVLEKNDLPKCNAVLRIIQALNISEEIRQGMGRISADESNNDPRSQKRRFRTPALFWKVTENRAGNVQQTQQTQNNPEHRREVPFIHTTL